MPHVSSSGGGDDLGSEDEVKVFKDEGEEEKRSSENLTEDKSDLIDLTESEVCAGGALAQNPLSVAPMYRLYIRVLSSAALTLIVVCVLFCAVLRHYFAALHTYIYMCVYTPHTSSLKIIPCNRAGSIEQHLSACISCVAGKGLARRWKLCDDGKDVGEV